MQATSSTDTDALSRFNELEGRIERVLEVLAATRDQKDAAEKALADAREKNIALQGELDEMREERREIVGRVERLLVGTIAALDPKEVE